MDQLTVTATGRSGKSLRHFHGEELQKKKIQPIRVHLVRGQRASTTSVCSVAYFIMVINVIDIIIADKKYCLLVCGRSPIYKPRKSGQIFS